MPSDQPVVSDGHRKAAHVNQLVEINGPNSGIIGYSSKINKRKVKELFLQRK